MHLRGALLMVADDAVSILPKLYCFIKCAAARTDRP